MSNKEDTNSAFKDTLKMLNNRRLLKIFFKKIPLNSAESISNKLLDVLDEIKLEYDLELEEKTRKEKVMASTIKNLEEQGITIKDVTEFITT